MTAVVIDNVDNSLLDYLAKKGVAVDYVPGMNRDELIRKIGAYDMLVGRSRLPIDAQIIDAGKRLRIIGRAGVGIENIDTAYAGTRGIRVVNAPGAATQSVAELVVGLMVSSSRGTFSDTSRIKGGRYRKDLGIELAGKTIGIIGFGHIGTRVAQLCSAIGMDVIVNDIVDMHDKAQRMGMRFLDKTRLYDESDVISLNLSMEGNRGPVIDAAAIDLMKEGAIVINTARAAAVDMKSIHDGLTSGKVGFYATDVLWHEPPKDPLELDIVNNDKVIVTSHIGANTKEAQARVAALAANNIGDAIDELLIEAEE